MIISRFPVSSSGRCTSKSHVLGDNTLGECGQPSRNLVKSVKANVCVRRMLKPLSEGEELTLQGRMFHKLTCTGVLPPPGEKHRSSCALRLLPEATPLLQGSKDISKQVSLKDIKSLFYQATFGTKDQNQAYVKITSNV